MLLLAASLFFSNPTPLDMPRAMGYLVRERGVERLEDRYPADELWLSRVVDGCWTDDEGRLFLHATLAVRPPARPDEDVTRVEFTRSLRDLKRRDKDALREAVGAVCGSEMPEKPSKPDYLPRGYRAVEYYHGTNRTDIVCAYLTEKSDTWRLAIWQLQEGDDFDDRLDEFEEEFFTNPPPEPLPKEPKPAPNASERDLHRADVRHSIAAYPEWHFTDAKDFAVLDDLTTRTLTEAFTNDYVRLQKRFAEVMPSPYVSTNELRVVRIFATREEYLSALELTGETNLMWSAAYWSDLRREIVAHAETGPFSLSDKELLAKLRHESFHEYLSRATALLGSSPWLNEGYAQYFEDEDSLDWKLDHRPTAEELENFSRLLPSLMLMDYDDFYDGSDEQRRLKYRLAWSMAVFLEKGAPELRFRPFKDMKRDYLAALLDERDPRVATARALKSSERLEKFVAEWLLYWKSRP